MSWQQPPGWGPPQGPPHGQWGQPPQPPGYHPPAPQVVYVKAHPSSASDGCARILLGIVIAFVVLMGGSVMLCAALSRF